MHLIKITDVRPAEEPNVRARHILFRATEGNDEELATARQEANAFKTRILVRVERRRQKFDNLITATVRVSDQDVEEEYLKNNARASAEFFLLRYADVPNDSVELTARDLRRFYDEHHDDFKRERVYTLEMASLSKLPVRQDTLDVLNDLEKARPFFAEAEDDSLFLLRNASERPYTSAFFAPADLDPEIAEAVFETPEPGTVVGPVISGNDVHLIKITDARPAEEPNVRARHILFSASPANEEELATARQEAVAFKTRIQNGEDFAALARERSDDPGSGARGGDVGWFGPDKMVPSFQEAAFGISVLETAFGQLMSLVHKGSVTLPHLIEKLTAAPAEFLGRPEMGTLKKDAPADITIFDPDAEWVVDASKFASKGKNTPLDGATLKGRVITTIVGGEVKHTVMAN